MKELNKILYDILLNINLNIKSEKIYVNYNLISKYFEEFNSKENSNYIQFEAYFVNFYNFCTKLPLDNMIKQSINFKY